MFNEQEVIASILKGSLPAFERLVRQYEKLVFTVVGKLANTREDVEDISQEVFIKIHKNLKTFRFESKLSTWIARIAYLTAINHLKKQKKHGMIHPPEDLDEFHFTDEHPEKISSGRDLSGHIHRLIGQMPAQYKMVLTLYHLYEFSYQEITTITGMPEGSIKGWLFRARKLLKEQIEDLQQPKTCNETQ